MVFRAVLGSVFLLFFNVALSADELKINPNHPDRYTVTKGDTLWDISGKFLQHPWQWPQLWKNNPQIQNPHWIYPGDTLYFSYVNGEPRLSLTPDGHDEKLLPRERETAVRKTVRMIPTDAIAQFLSSPQVMSEEDIGKSPYVIEIAGYERLIAGAGDRIFARGIDESMGLEYTIFRPGQPYISPDTHEVLGFEAQYVGDATIQAFGDPATLLIDKSSLQVRQGDRLMISEKDGLLLNYFPRPPERQIVGHIISVMGGITQIGQHDIVVIDKGLADGLKPGHTFEIYRTGRIVIDKYHSEEPEAVKLPDEMAGMLMVFRPFERVSYALVMEAIGAIHTLDRIQTP